MALGEGGGDATAPLISSDSPNSKRHLNIFRNGNEWTASAHVITAVIGSGVLSLAWSMAQLGWVAGPGTMVVFASVTALQSTIFADCYRSPDPEHGPHRNRTYAQAVERNLGSSSALVCQFLQQTALFGYGIAYTITASTSFRASTARRLASDARMEILAIPAVSPRNPGVRLASMPNYASGACSFLFSAKAAAASSNRALAS